MIKEHTVTKAEILYPGAFMSEEEYITVTKRSPEVLAKKYPTSFAISFYDVVLKEVEVAGEAQTISSKRFNQSRKYYPDGQVYNVDGIKSLKGDYRILISNMEGNGWKFVVKTRCGNFQPFDPKKDEVI